MTIALQTDPWSYLVIILVIVLLLYMVQTYIASKKERKALYQLEEQYKFIATIKCLSNDYTAEKEFSEGDFVGKIVGECPKCGNKLIITSIYALYKQKT